MSKLNHWWNTGKSSCLYGYVYLFYSNLQIKTLFTEKSFETLVKIHIFKTCVAIIVYACYENCKTLHWTLTSTPDTKQETPGNIAHMSLILTQASSRSQTQKALSGIKSLVKKKKMLYFMLWNSTCDSQLLTANCFLPNWTAYKLKRSNSLEKWFTKYIQRCINWFIYHIKSHLSVFDI